MEENKEFTFEVICDNEEVLKKAICIYNSTYKTNFELEEYILDEVNFAKIKGNVSLSDIFDLGCIYTRLQSNTKC
ncbi:MULTISPECIES: hypothetical protein [Capnocytophaga]|uniref:Uncharacterized protein n=2 Tax=Capnocytophaga canimorsus TaxID=28188 RepID=F9YT99_CAPCC|nr:MULTISPECIES: hypothetical protein [Capnocytophaga]AEK24018.1 Hypothetical protein Ccan_19020 [Capnocytophaga canimorsus Cc5]ATA91588.1 hypothetical protein CGC56_05035 [Capnocytophaga canimorsus]WGU68579.1 hypothetical protein QIU19_00710 [Capnocytophaga canimorsus]WGU70314.1 hypothetical protein QIU18_12845 [Capnocytophaga canimorsus]CEN49088.1 conserved hypothetical protein [Capnocytophaga canimorsus]